MNRQLATQRTRMYAALREAHPLYFGDPLTFYSDAAYRGPAYGEKLGGGGALVGAVLAVATGGALLGFTTLASTLTTISVIGGIVGAVTGNKTFSTIGALAGLGGAFMSLSSAGSLGDGLKDWSGKMEETFKNIGSNVSSAATSGASDTLSATDVQQAMDMNAGASAQPVQDTGSYNLSQTSNANTELAYDALKRDTGLIDTNPGDGSTISPETTAQKVAGTDSSATMVDGATPAQVEGIAKQGATPAAAPSDNVASKVAGADSSATMVDGATPAQVEGIAKQGAAQVANNNGSGGSLFDKLSSFVAKNKELSEMALKGVSSAYVSPQDKARARYYSAAAMNTEAQTANMNSAAGVDVASMFRVNPNASVYKPKPTVAAGVRPAGLIQSRT